MYTGGRKKYLKQSNPHVHWGKKTVKTVPSVCILGKKTIKTVQSACTLRQENTGNGWNSLIRKYTGHSLLFLIVPFMWRKAYHRFGTGQHVAHNENRIPPQFAHTVSQNIIYETKQILNTLWRNIICETKLFSPWGMVQSSQCFHSCTGWTGCILWNISTERGRHDLFISAVTWFWKGSSSLFLSGCF